VIYQHFCSNFSRILLHITWRERTFHRFRACHVTWVSQVATFQHSNSSTTFMFGFHTPHDLSLWMLNFSSFRPVDREWRLRFFRYVSRRQTGGRLVAAGCRPPPPVNWYPAAATAGRGVVDRSTPAATAAVVTDGRTNPVRRRRLPLSAAGPE